MHRLSLYLYLSSSLVFSYILPIYFTYPFSSYSCKQRPLALQINNGSEFKFRQYAPFTSHLHFLHHSIIVSLRFTLQWRIFLDILHACKLEDN
ncbi:hypothetical protein BDQ17DRAFT_551719 [Cyathus striatus]|nr:hypothetical protein BDQ17DRAFT_850499 [Cyathus striatus]KAF9002206.1 hypothetical protein BDQ17DRAFT_551719 [Cyathus striatus]